MVAIWNDVAVHTLRVAYIKDFKSQTVSRRSLVISSALNHEIGDLWVSLLFLIPKFVNTTELKSLLEVGRA